MIKSLGSLVGAAVVVVATLVLVTGCVTDVEVMSSPTPTPSATPTPTPTPTGPPPLADLIVSPDGLGPLVLGEQPPVTGVTDVVVYDAECAYGYSNDPQTGAWSTQYPSLMDDGTTRQAFDVAVDDAGVSRIDIRSPEIRTATGLGVGSARADLLAAYPAFDEVVVKEGIETVYGVRGDRGWLMFEVLDAPAGPRPPDVVIVMRVGGLERGVYGTASTDDVIGVCVG